jgi:LysM repeat protein
LKGVQEEVKKAVVQAPKPALKTSARLHTVQDGESLWKISRQYKVKVEDIVKLNDIQKDRVYPGMTIKIPE